MLIEPLVIYGPAGCGKTRSAEALAAHFGADTVVDNWDGTTPLRGSTLALSNATGPESMAYSSMSFEAAMRALVTARLAALPAFSERGR